MSQIPCWIIVSLLLISPDNRRNTIAVCRPRAGLALLTAAKAWTYMDNRDAVIPEDLQAVLPAVAGHRLRSGNNDSEAIVAPDFGEGRCYINGLWAS